MVILLGQYTQYYGADMVDRTFKVEPADVYQGESNKTFTITFEAKGPMYDSLIVIPIPTFNSTQLR